MLWSELYACNLEDLILVRLLTRGIAAPRFFDRKLNPKHNHAMNNQRFTPRVPGLPQPLNPVDSSQVFPFRRPSTTGRNEASRSNATAKPSQTAGVDGLSAYRALPVALVIFLFLFTMPCTLFGETFTFTGDGNWGVDTNWSPTGVPEAGDTVVNDTTSLGTLNVNGTERTILDFTAADLPGLWQIRGGNGPSTLNITGTLSMNSPSQEVRFRSHSTAEGTRLSVVVNTMVADGGTITFGAFESATQTLEDLTVTGTTTIGDGGSIELNVAGSSTFADVVLNSGGQLRIAQAPADTHRNTTVASISGGGEIYAKSGGSGSNSATLIINGESGSTTFSGVLADRGFGTSSPVLGLQKDGEGTQIFTGGIKSYTGGTVINAGTLLVNNTTGATGLGRGEVNVTGGVLGGTGVIALNDANINFTGSSTLAVGNVNDPTGSGIVDFLIQKNSGTMHLALAGDVTVRMDIWSSSDYERLVFGSDSNALDSIALENATLRIDSSFGGWAAGQSYQLFDWGGVVPSTQFGTLDLPDIGSLSWDTSGLYSTGTLSVIPEPNAALFGLGLLGIVMLLHRRCKSQGLRLKATGLLFFFAWTRFRLPGAR